MTARQIIEARIGRPLGSLREMRPDERRAVKLLAIQLIKRRQAVTPKSERTKP
jgi:hypothetical protein